MREDTVVLQVDIAGHLHGLFEGERAVIHGNVAGHGGSVGDAHGAVGQVQIGRKINCAVNGHLRSRQQHIAIGHAQVAGGHGAW